MSEPIKPVETTEAKPAGAEPTAIDYQAELALKDAELAKVKEERENYKKGLLKAKGKLPDSELPGEHEQDLEELVNRKVEEKLLDTREAQIQKEKAELLEKALKENRELRLAAANRAQIPSGSQGSSSETTVEPTGQFFSDAQIAELKKKGWDDKKIEALKKNVLKAK